MNIRRNLSGENIFPAMLKSLSTGTEEDGTPRMFFANLESRGYFFWLSYLLDIGPLLLRQFQCIHPPA